MWQFGPSFRGGLFHLPLLWLFGLQLGEWKEGGLFVRAKALIGKRGRLIVPPFSLDKRTGWPYEREPRVS